MEQLQQIVTAFMVISYTVVGCVGSLPQIVKTFKTKSVGDISLLSWVMWNVSALSYLLYAVIVNPTFELVFTSVLDVSFNVIILIQILYYGYIRKKK